MPIDSYQKKYRIRLAQKGNSSKSFEVTFPYMVLEKEARKRNLTVEQFIEQYQYELQRDLGGREKMSDKHVDIEGKMFSPEDEFDGSTLIQKISNDHSYSPEKLMEMIKEWGIEEANRILSIYIWPKQTQGLQNWLQIVFQN